MRTKNISGYQILSSEKKFSCLASVGGLLLMVMSSGCGPSPREITLQDPTLLNPTPSASSQPQMTTQSTPFQATTSSNTSTMSSSSSAATAETRKGIPALNFKVRAVGYNATSVTVRAGRVLRVIFVPGMQDRAVANTGFYPQYSKLGVYIGIGTSLQATPLLDNGLRSGNMQGSQVIDLSSQISSSCVGSDTTCRSEVTITVTKPNTDYSCLNFGGAYCPYQRMYPTHPWNGTLYIQTDDTDPVEDVRPVQAPANGIL